MGSRLRRAGQARAKSIGVDQAPVEVTKPQGAQADNPVGANQYGHEKAVRKLMGVAEPPPKEVPLTEQEKAAKNAALIMEVFTKAGLDARQADAAFRQLARGGWKGISVALVDAAQLAVRIMLK